MSTILSVLSEKRREKREILMPMPQQCVAFFIRCCCCLLCVPAAADRGISQSSSLLVIRLQNLCEANASWKFVIFLLKLSVRWKQMVEQRWPMGETARSTARVLKLRQPDEGDSAAREEKKLYQDSHLTLWTSRDSTSLSTPLLRLYRRCYFLSLPCACTRALSSRYLFPLLFTEYECVHETFTISSA